MPAIAKRAIRHVVAIILVANSGGCATYTPLPLATHPDLAHRIEDLQGGGDVHVPLDEAAVLRLVLLNNPALEASRAQRGLAQAQVLDASVLPNPSVQAGVGFLVSGAGDGPAWSVGFAQSLQGLATRGARRDEVRASASATDARLLWESWVTLSRARQLIVDVVAGEQRLELQERAARLLEARATSLQKAVARGDESVDSVSAVFAAASDARATCADARHTLLGQRAELAALLRLSADAPLPLAPLPVLPTFDAVHAQEAMATAGEHRPDLVALRFGYAAQEAKLRGAILSQFAPLSLGLDATRDSDKVLNIGPTVSFELPLFDRQQGKIAIEEATRKQLHDEYTTRLNAATADAQLLVSAIVDNEQASSRELTDVAPLEAASRAFARGDIDAAAYDDLSIATLGRSANDMTRDIYRREQRIAFDALTGAGLPDALPPRMNP
jgi:outer membrane protein TolC